MSDSDKSLKDMLRYIKKNEPSPEFTGTVMNKINSLNNQASVKNESFFQKFKFWIVLTITFSSITFAGKLFINTAETSGSFKIVEYLRILFSSTSKIYEINLNNTIVVIFLSVVCLLVIDKIVKKSGKSPAFH